MLIKKYNNKANVKAWQMLLLGKAEADGVWGSKTTSATKRFQSQHGLTADGIVGESTLSIAMQHGFAGFGQPEVTPAPIVKNKTLLISAGHTNVVGKDRGAAGNGLIEGIEGVRIRDRVAEILRAKGFSVREDGGDGINEPLSKALKLIPGTALAVEIHFNAGPPTATGVEVLSMPGRKTQSQFIADGINRALSLPLRGDKGWKADTSGQHSRLAFCRSGGLIAEVCFISSKGDTDSYKANFETLCKGLADGMARAV